MCLRTRFCPIVLLTLFVIPVGSRLGAEEDEEDHSQRRDHLLITKVTADLDATPAILIIEGEGLRPRRRHVLQVFMGQSGGELQELPVLFADRTRVEAELLGTDAGTYLLVLSTGPGLAHSFIMDVTLGAAGPAGPPGPPGEAGPPGNLALAGLTCPAGEAVVGFDDDGELVCQAVGGAGGGAPDASGAFAAYLSEGRTVYLWRSSPCADLTALENFCPVRNLQWWAPRSQADAQQLIDFAFGLDNFHTWIQVFGVSTGLGGSVGSIDGFTVAVDGPFGRSASADGWSAFRRTAGSFCNPETDPGELGEINNRSCCWDTDHPYDWLVCETP